MQISKLEHLVRAMFCAPGRNRTYDRQIRRLLLYPLSYGGRATPSAITRPARDHCSAEIRLQASSYVHERGIDPVELACARTRRKTAPFES
jgi:hypothetical protein